MILSDLEWIYQIYIEENIFYKSLDSNYFEAQLYENEKIARRINNKLDGLLNYNDEILKIVSFEEACFVEIY